MKIDKTSKAGARRAAIARADEELLAALGYKQEFMRAFTPLEVAKASQMDLLS